VKTVSAPEEMLRESRAARRAGRRVGFVPTMGYLHEGHLSLVRRSCRECDLTAVSIFVNPTQFGPGEDLERYPRDLDRDTALLEAEGVQILFAPAAEAVYPPGNATFVDVERLGDRLCGAFRPGHFRGVATVVAKLFNMTRPHAAYLGQKDWQQAMIISRVAADLGFDLEIVVCPTVREEDGLAMSSRNAYLTTKERQAAPSLRAALEAARLGAGERFRSAAEIREFVTSRLRETPLRLQYVEVVRSHDLEPVESLKGEILVAAAAHLGATRLIDNVIIKTPNPEASPSCEGKC
jgi:pantoate--beta-alanine ligase